MVNPFTPGFGLHPPVIAGRRDIMRRFAEAYNPEVGHHPWSRTYFRADRGLGKTVLLDAAHELPSSAAGSLLKRTEQ